MKRAAAAAAFSLVALGMALAGARAEAASPERVVVGLQGVSRVVGARGGADLARASTGADAEHRANLGGTEIVAQALRAGSIDAYPEYTGTLREVVLHAPGATRDELRSALAQRGTRHHRLARLRRLVRARRGAAAWPTRDVAAHHLRPGTRASRAELRGAFRHEFLGRADGWPGLRARYGIDLAEVRGVEHHLAFEALAAGRADVVDAYTTDPEIDRLWLRVLDDDRAFFPRYEAVVVYRLDLQTRAPRPSRPCCVWSAASTGAPWRAATPP